MAVQLLSQDELVIAALATKRPVAFLIGSPLSLRDGVGVPGVTEMVELVRREVRDRAAIALPRFDAALGDQTGGEAYQQAMQWLGAHAGQDAINDVIHAAVLQARKGTASRSFADDGDPADWNIPSGTIALGELVARESERFRGPILTTNFDPLVSLAVRSIGGQTGRLVLTADGTFAGALQDDLCTVVHLHGFWRDSDSLHTQAQLTHPRPRLTKSLQRLLQGRTLIVVAYGEWDDVFTRALTDLMNDEQARLDVVWCFHEADPTAVQERHRKLLDAVGPALVMNRFRAFGGVDCHRIFEDILTAARTASSGAPASHRGEPDRPSAPAPTADRDSPLAGWEWIDAAYLRALEPLHTEEIVRYFDGATPTWRHATSADIPVRADAAEIAARLARLPGAKTDGSLQLIRAAGGEGKTTLLLQAATAAATSGGWNVLWRPAPRLRLPAETLCGLDPDCHWLVVVDDAENLVADLGEAARLLHDRGRSNVHFLLAARDTDWRHAHGDRHPWTTWLQRHPDILLRELGLPDAQKMVRAWQKYGSDGLRQLSALPDIDAQVAALLRAVRTPAAHDEGSFFGGLLAVRFSPEGLRAHVIALLARLKDRPIADGDATLFDALSYVAACHAVGISGLDEKVLADLVGVPRDWVQTRVVNPLGEEAAAVRSAGLVVTRHRNVAAAVLVAAEQDLDADLAEIWSAIARQTVRTGQEVVIDRSCHAAIIHAGPRLYETLPRQFHEHRRKEIAIATTTTSIAAEPDRLSPIVDLGKTYRNAHDYHAAVEVFRQHLSGIASKVDGLSVVRGYWYEWGVSEGRAGNPVSAAWLQGLSLADHLRPAELVSKRVKLSCAGVGIPFAKLARQGPGAVFALGLRAATYIGRRSQPDVRTIGYFDRFDRDADTMGVPVPKSMGDAIDALAAAVAQAGKELRDPFLKRLLAVEHVSFAMLREFMEPVSETRAVRQHLESPAAATPPRSESLAPSGFLDERIDRGIQRVLARAWRSLPAEASEGDRFKILRRTALDEISRLSPAIRRPVAAYFEIRKWEPLMTHRPTEDPHERSGGGTDTRS